MAATRPAQRFGFVDFLVGHFFLEVLVLDAVFAELPAAACAREFRFAVSHGDGALKLAGFAADLLAFLEAFV